MLDVVGVSNVADLFANVPDELRARAALALPPGLSESEVCRALAALAERNRAVQQHVFLGAGAYPHFVPAVVDNVLQRAEFYSAYTPYQPEVSQGTLQAIFEFQSLIAMLFEMDVANASMYDGASAMAEAVLMAVRIHPKRPRVLIARSVHPQYREVVHTYASGAGNIELVDVSWAADGRVDDAQLAATLDDRVAAVVVGYPNVFGVVEDLAGIAARARAHGALLVTVTTEALALGLLTPPGAQGADIVVAEGQSLGVPLSYGGPGVGLLATRSAFVRSMPGRLVGEAFDGAGRRGYVLTLATREQHIRREKATSNICTNHGLVALAVTVYLSLLGKMGLRQLATANTAAAHRLAARLTQSGRWRAPFAAPFFNEFVVAGADAAAAWESAREHGVIAGVRLGEWYPELSDSLLLCVTETHDRAATDALVSALRA
jgi:glycine cleavage system P protein (glycine dehydrogenase) subunit 1